MTWPRSLLPALLGLALVLSGLGAPTALADSAVKPKAKAVTVTGKGWGHGRGMSQYGARGAAQKGLAYAKILAFYYPGTTLSTMSGSATIRVLISSDTDNYVNVTPSSGLRLIDSAGKSYVLPTGSKYQQWRIGRSNGKRVLSYRNSSGKWVKKSTSRISPAKVWWFENTRTKKVSVVLPSGKGKRTYRGKVAARFLNGGIRSVNYVSMQDYLRSVVPSEMPASWPTEAVKAQTVAARTYAARYRANLAGKRVYDICDTSSCQVYKGTSTEYSASDKAVSATKGKVLTYKSAYAWTEFSSSNGGWSAPGDVAYLKAKADPYDGISSNPNRTWTKTLTNSAIQKAYPSIGSLVSVQVTKRDGHGRWGGRVETVRIKGSKKTVTVSGGAFKSAFGLKERYFTISSGANQTT